MRYIKEEKKTKVSFDQEKKCNETCHKYLKARRLVAKGMRRVKGRVRFKRHCCISKDTCSPSNEGQKPQSPIWKRAELAVSGPQGATHLDAEQRRRNTARIARSAACSQHDVERMAQSVQH